MTASPALPRSNLPTRLTTFIGRESEIAEITSLLERERLITLVGAGGCGKTRLAQVVARDRSQAVLWVDLSTLAEDELVVGAIASTLRLKEVPGRSQLEIVQDAVDGESALLLLDNCEHLIATCARVVDELVGSCPNLTILATSREPLGVEG
ncbi:MAG TPA: NB-ARC domain-containing protein, partial [Actinomycetota bacterium]|nr:NB-ARC domain-containing protein [Actinomycetota bacterium]